MYRCCYSLWMIKQIVSESIENKNRMSVAGGIGAGKRRGGLFSIISIFLVEY